MCIVLESTGKWGKVATAAAALRTGVVTAQGLYQRLSSGLYPTGMKGNDVNVGKETCNHGLRHSVQSLNGSRGDRLCYGARIAQYLFDHARYRQIQRRRTNNAIGEAPTRRTIYTAWQALGGLSYAPVERTDFSVQL